MPRLCRMCHAESDTEECTYCAGPTAEVVNIYELKYLVQCNECGATVTKKIDHDQRDILGWPHFELRFCPVCDKRTMHENKFLCANLTSYDSFLENAYKQELEAH